MPGPFHGLKVVDLTSVVVGPYTTQMLADMGAEVVKVEPPEGDMVRIGTPRRHAGMAANYLQLNRNKRAVGLDLKSEAGADALRRLIRNADVFIHNMRPEPLARLGFDYPEVEKLNPAIVYCNIWGFGRAGRYAGWAAFDDVIQGACGLVALEAFNGREARYVPMLIADKTTGVFAAYAIAGALYHKLATGEGQEVEVPMFETMTSFTMIENVAGAGFEPPLGPPGSERHAIPLRWPYKSKDGYVCVLPSSDRHWQAMLTIGGKAELLSDPRFKDRASRLAHRLELAQLVEGMVTEQTSDWWVDHLSKAGVPCMKIHTLEEVVADPHLEDVGFWHRAQHPTEGEIRLMRPPYTLSKTPAEIRTLPPRYGQHTGEVLEELGYSADQIAAMLEAGAAVGQRE